MAAETLPREEIALRFRPTGKAKTLILHALGARTDEKKIHTILTKFGLTDTVALHRGKKNWALVSFVSSMDADTCIANLDRALIDGQTVRVRRWKEIRPNVYIPTQAIQLVNIMNHFLGFSGWSHSVQGSPYLRELRVPDVTSPNTKFEAEFEARARVWGFGFDGIGHGGGAHSSEDKCEAVTRARKKAVTNALKDVLSRVVMERDAVGQVLSVRIMESSEK